MAAKTQVQLINIGIFRTHIKRYFFRFQKRNDKNVNDKKLNDSITQYLNPYDPGTHNFKFEMK